jgi:hypothetical protein
MACWAKCLEHAFVQVNDCLAQLGQSTLTKWDDHFLHVLASLLLQYSFNSQYTTSLLSQGFWVWWQQTSFSSCHSTWLWIDPHFR